MSAVAVGTPDGVVLQALKGGFTERIQVPAQRRLATDDRARKRRPLLPGRCDGRREYDLRELGSRGRQAEQDDRGDLDRGRRWPRVHGHRRGSLGSVVQEVHVRIALGSLVAALACAAALAPVGGATSECRGIQACIRVPARGWSCRRAGTRPTCSPAPAAGASSAASTHRSRRATCDSASTGAWARLCSPVSTTTRYALFHAVSISKHVQAFQPLLGCVPMQGGGGRSTVSAHVTPPGPSLELPLAHRRDRTRVGRVRQGLVLSETSSSSGRGTPIAFRTKQPPQLADAARVRATTVSWSARRSSSPLRRATGCRSTCMRSSRSARSAHRELRVAVAAARCC